jgi:predicted permease
VFGEPGRHDGLTQPDFDELRRSATLVDGMASYGFMIVVATPDQGRPVTVSATRIHGDYFEILGVSASEGRLLAAEETRLDANPLVAVVSESFRDRIFGSEESVVGRTIPMNGQPVEIVGVAAGGFGGAERGGSTDAWLPAGSLVPLLGFTYERLRSRESTTHRDILVGLREGVSPDAIQAQVGQVLAAIRRSVPGASESLPASDPTLYEGLHTPPSVRELTRRTLGMMAWAVALILAISCANVANLLLFRNLSRRGALATLRALGASSARLARHQLMESALLGLLGSVAALGVAWLISVPFRGERLVRMPAFDGLTLGAHTVLFVATAALLTAILFGAAPAALVGRFDLGAALKSSREHDTGRMGLLRAMLSTGQIALTLALLVGGLLMVRTITNLRAVDTGLDIDGVAWTLIVDRSNDVPDADDHLRHREMLAALRTIPEVEAAALDTYGPHGSQFRDVIRVPGTPEPEPGIQSTTAAFQVTPGWFEMLRMEPLSGRTFRDEDWTYPPGNDVVLTASLARRLFGRVDVAGATVVVGRRNGTERRVVGVVGEYRSMTSPGEPTDAFFVPHGSVPLSPQLSVMTRIRSRDAAALPRVREVLESFHPGVPIAEPQFLTERVALLRTEERLLGYLLWMLSAFGVLMSAVGLYGVIYFMVASRRRELGIRRTLGADGPDIVRAVGRPAVLIVISGTVVGAITAYALARVLQSQLFGVQALDAFSYAGACAVILVAALVAGMTPARAALAVDPLAILREE